MGNGESGSRIAGDFGLIDFDVADESTLMEMVTEDPLEIIKGLMRPSADFLQWVSRYFQKTLGFDMAFVGEVCGDNWNRVQTLEVCQRGETLDNFVYDLQGTPCADVLYHGISYCPTGVADAYPDDRILRDMGQEAYVGLALFNEAGAPLGIVVLLHTSPVSEEVARAAAAMLRIYRPRMEAELTYRHSMRSMEFAASEALTSQSTLEGLVEVLAKSTGMRSVFVSVKSRLAASKATTLVHFLGGKKSKNFDYDVEETPCSSDMGNESIGIREDLHILYPNFPQILKRQAQAFFGVSIFDSRGERLGHICLLHDAPVKVDVLGTTLARLLVSRLRAEVRRREVEKEHASLERSLMDAKRRESIGVFASGIAHDFNNLLFAIYGRATVMQTQRQDDMQLREQLQTIIDASDHASDLCEQLLTYAGQRDSVVTQIELNQVIRRCERVATLFASEEKEIRMILEPSELFMMGSEAHIQRVVMNLVKNAADASESGGVITIETRICERPEMDFQSAVVGSGISGGRFATMRISDQGCGMDKEQLARVFKPFVTTKGDAGHGLGLAVVCGTIEEHSGAMEVESTPGFGTRFTLSFPLVAID